MAIDGAERTCRAVVPPTGNSTAADSSYVAAWITILIKVPYQKHLTGASVKIGYDFAVNASIQWGKCVRNTSASGGCDISTSPSLAISAGIANMSSGTTVAYSFGRGFDFRDTATQYCLVSSCSFTNSSTVSGRATYSGTFVLNMTVINQMNRNRTYVADIYAVGEIDSTWGEDSGYHLASSSTAGSISNARAGSMLHVISISEY